MLFIFIINSIIIYSYCYYLLLFLLIWFIIIIIEDVRKKWGVVMACPKHKRTKDVKFGTFMLTMGPISFFKNFHPLQYIQTAHIFQNLRKWSHSSFLVSSSVVLNHSLVNQKKAGEKGKQVYTLRIQEKLRCLTIIIIVYYIIQVNF